MLISDLTVMLTILVSQHLSFLMLTIMASMAAVRFLNRVCGQGLDSSGSERIQW